MVLLSRAAVALAATSLVVAGCSEAGGGGAGATPNASASADAAAGAAMRAVAACLRSHGYPNAPDPVQDPEGNWGFAEAPPGSMPERSDVVPACDDMARRAKSLARKSDRDPVSSADMAKLRAYSACVRRHGVPDWPDPVARGHFELPQRLLPPHGEAIWRTADEACKSVLGEVDVAIADPAGGRGGGK
jgi:hypothetical protein